MELEQLKTYCTADLIETWDVVEGMSDMEAVMMRGWIIDELEQRDPDALNAWIESHDLDLRGAFAGA